MPQYRSPGCSIHTHLRPRLPAFPRRQPPGPCRRPMNRSLRPRPCCAPRTHLLPRLEAGQALDAPALRSAMTSAFGAGDADGAWSWKDAYEAAEAALVLFLQRYGRAMRRQAGTSPDAPATMLDMLRKIAALEPSQTRRSEDQLRLQQFSTPLPLAYAALQAAAIRPGDVVLEPSAGTGMLAVMAQCALGTQSPDSLHLNEIAAVRSQLLASLFPAATVTTHNAESLADRLPSLRPTVILMNPPFSASPGIERTRRHVDLKHIRSAASMLPPGGRLVTISSSACSPASDRLEGGLREPRSARRSSVHQRHLGQRLRTQGHQLRDPHHRPRPRLRCHRHRPDRPRHRRRRQPIPAVRDPRRRAAQAAGRDPSPGRSVRPTPRAPGADARTPQTRPRTHPNRPSSHEWGPVSELRYATSLRQAGRRRRPGHRPLRRLEPRSRPRRRRRSAPHPARAVRRHGRRRASHPLLQTPASRLSLRRRPALRRPDRERRPRRRGASKPSPRALPHRRGLGDRPPHR